MEGYKDEKSKEIQALIFDALLFVTLFYNAKNMQFMSF